MKRPRCRCCCYFCRARRERTCLEPRGEHNNNTFSAYKHANLHIQKSQPEKERGEEERETNNKSEMQREIVCRKLADFAVGCTVKKRGQIGRGDATRRAHSWFKSRSLHFSQLFFRGVFDHQHQAEFAHEYANAAGMALFLPA